MERRLKEQPLGVPAAEPPRFDVRYNQSQYDVTQHTIHLDGTCIQYKLLSDTDIVSVIADMSEAMHDPERGHYVLVYDDLGVLELTPAQFLDILFTVNNYNR